jgi:hypothetical protein
VKEKESVTMAQKATGSPLKVKFVRKGSKGAVMPGLVITSPPASITLQPVDSATPPNPVPVLPTDSAVGTVTSDSSLFTIVPGPDTLHYTATLAAGIPMGTVVNLSATLIGTVQGVQESFTASVQLTINISPPLPVATDLQIIIGT